MRSVKRFGLVAVAAFMAAAAAEAGAAPHPEPRVIVTASSVSGPHDRAEVERAARLAWGKIISCYKSHARRQKGGVVLELTVSGTGKVSSARRTSSTLKSDALASCLVNVMRGREMPQASSSSRATIEIQLAPGDAP